MSFASQFYRYYQSKGHQKKQLSGGGEKLQDLKRDLHGFIASKANINLIETTVSYGGETFLSEEVAINILQARRICSMFKDYVCRLKN